MLTAIFQGVLSASVVAFCMFLIGAGKPSDSAWTILSSIVAYWMPSPITTVSNRLSKKEEKE